MSTLTYTADVAVIGAGAAGIMAYLRAVLNCDRTVLFMGDANTKRRGRATWVHEVENIPGMHGLNKPILATTKSTLNWVKNHEHLSQYSQIVKGKVDRIEILEGKKAGFRLHYTEKKTEHTLNVRAVILATGIMDIQPMINGSIEPILPFANVGHVLYCLRCDGHQTIGDELSLIGSGDKTVHIGTLLAERYGHKSIKVLTHGDEPNISEELQPLVRAYNIQFYTDEIIEVVGDPKVALEGYRLKSGEFVSTNKSLVALGSLIYNELFRDLPGAELDSGGRVITNADFETSVPGIFAIGDLAAGTKMQIYTAWDEAVIAAETINRRLRMEKREALLAAVPV